MFPSLLFFLIKSKVAVDGERLGLLLDVGLLLDLQFLHDLGRTLRCALDPL